RAGRGPNEAEGDRAPTDRSARRNESAAGGTRKAAATARSDSEGESRLDYATHGGRSWPRGGGRGAGRVGGAPAPIGPSGSTAATAGKDGGQPYRGAGAARCPGKGAGGVGLALYPGGKGVGAGARPVGGN